MIFCIDSNVIIWGIKRQASAGQEEMILRADNFFNWVDEQSHDIIIPTVVISEILAPEPPEIRSRYLKILSDSFIIAPFDTRAATKYAELLHNKFDDIKKLMDESGTSRQKMKIDHQIIAIALVNNASCIYSTDNGLKSFASGIIDVRDLSPAYTTTQLTLIDHNTPTIDSKNGESEENPF